MLSILLSNRKSHRRQRVCELQHRVRVVWAAPRPNSKPRHARHGTAKCSAYGGGESSGDSSSADDDTGPSTRRGSRTTAPCEGRRGAPCRYWARFVREKQCAYGNGAASKSHKASTEAQHSHAGHQLKPLEQAEVRYMFGVPESQDKQKRQC